MSYKHGLKVENRELRRVGVFLLAKARKKYFITSGSVEVEVELDFMPEK